MVFKHRIDWTQVLKQMVEQTSEDDIHLLFNHLQIEVVDKYGQEALIKEFEWMHLLQHTIKDSHLKKWRHKK